ncbi:unnamed protein product [Clonostachys byssicola]|uniref:Xylanolytic transcriptional activator regulatory domain-containing protein n=1 Tax=Clonostachys byssicola TaxID=160290 RepID=A0A9N9Y0A8_9HYPO|nr:unnamed protein product [Clonostachys byssicola]
MPRKPKGRQSIRVQTFPDTDHGESSEDTRSMASAAMDYWQPPNNLITVTGARDEDGTPTPSVPLEQPLAMNWLPFDDSLTDYPLLSGLDLTPPMYLTEASAVPLGEGRGQTASSQHHSERLSADNNFTSHHNHLSDLIQSMGGIQQRWTENNDSYALEATSSLDRLNNLYSNGAGFRSSQADRCFRRRHVANTVETSPTAEDGQESWLITLSIKAEENERDPDSRFIIPEDIFQEILLRLYPQPGSEALSDSFLNYKSLLLNKSSLSLFVKSYFESFHEIYSFIDWSFLSMPVWGWSLTLAVAATGARYLGLTPLTQLSEELCHALHNLLLGELHFQKAQDSLPYLQARALAASGMCQSQQPDVLRAGIAAWALVTNSCQQLRILSEDDHIGAYEEGQNLDRTWIAWRFRETRRRTGFFIWLTDCYLAFMSENQPTLPPHALKLRIPCCERLWQAETVQKWCLRNSQSIKENSGVAMISEEVSRDMAVDLTQRLWRGEPPPSGAPFFATLILLFGLLRKRWTMVNYITDLFPLTGQKSQYCGAIPEYMRWRNQICDSLDLLHWEALSASIKAGGLEGPIFLHLHLARLVILAPVRELLEHVTEVTQASKAQLLPHTLYCYPRNEASWRRTMLTWFCQDRYKARLAIIHAGAVFWHTRRYCSGSFADPYTIFLASLVLWTFGTASEMVNSNSQLNMSGELEFRQHVLPGGLEGSSSQQQDAGNRRRMPRIIQVDRPMDDELVQHFIRSGEGMRVHLEGIDDLCSPEGSLQILHEGATILLQAPKVWSLSGAYASVLKSLTAIAPG